MEVATYVSRHVTRRRSFISALALEFWTPPPAGRTGVADRQRIRRQPDVGAGLRSDLDLGRVRKFVSANDIDGGVMVLDQGGLAGLLPVVSVRAIEARGGVFSDRHQAKLCITEGGTGHHAPWSVGAEGLFRPNKIRGFLDQIAA